MDVCSQFFDFFLRLRAIPFFRFCHSQIVRKIKVWSKASYYWLQWSDQVTRPYSWSGLCDWARQQDMVICQKCFCEALEASKDCYTFRTVSQKVFRDGTSPLDMFQIQDVLQRVYTYIVVWSSGWNLNRLLKMTIFANSLICHLTHTCGDAYGWDLW